MTGTLLFAATSMNARIAFAFAAGMVAAVNPCGFAMLPAYLSYFLGIEGSGRPERPIMRAWTVSATMTLGFVIVFGVVGLAVASLYRRIAGHLGWVTLGVGLGLIALGIALLAGKELVVRLPKLAKGGTSRELWSMLLFGISYAVASLSCTLGPFVAATSSTLSDRGLLVALVIFVAYGLGMGALIAILTVAVAMAQRGLVNRMRSLVRYVNRLSGLLLVVAGAYVAYYGVYELRGPGHDPVVDRAQAVQRWLNDLIDRVGPGRLGLVALALALASAIVSILRRRSQRRRGSARDVLSATSSGTSAG